MSDEWGEIGKGGIFNRLMWPIKVATGQTATEIGQGIANTYTGNRDQDNLEKTWEREDTAVQRKMADMKQAGVNPMAAFLGGGGGGAQAGMAASTQGRQSAAEHSMSIMQFDKQMSILDAQAKQLNSIATLNDARAKTEVTNQDLNTQMHSFRNTWNAEALRKINGEIDRIGIQNYRDGLQSIGDMQGITRNDIAIVRDLIAVEADRIGITGARLELIARKIAIETGQTELKGLRHDIALAQDKGWPVGNWNTTQILADAIKDGLDKFTGMWNIPSVDDIHDKVMEVGQEGLDILAGDMGDEDSRVKQIISNIIGYVPAVAIIRAIRNRVRENRERDITENERGEPYGGM